MICPLMSGPVFVTTMVKSAVHLEDCQKENCPAWYKNEEDDKKSFCTYLKGRVKCPHCEKEFFIR